MKKNTLNEKMTLEGEAHNYRLWCHLAPGSIIPMELIQCIKEIALTGSQELSEKEKDFVHEVLTQDISKVEQWKLIELKKALYKANIRVDIEAESKISFKKTFRLPGVFKNFTGREFELNQLRSNFIEQNIEIQKICGTGGIGKSQLARFFARQMLHEGHYKWVVWLTGDQDEKKALYSLKSNLNALAFELGLDVTQLSEDNIFKLIYEQLHARGDGLIVFDDIPNFTTMAMVLPDYYRYKKFDVLITTRNSRYFGANIEQINLDIFTFDDAICYVKNSLKIAVLDEDAKLLADTLNRYPLALTQATSYINDKKCKVKVYCERYQYLIPVRQVYLNAPVNDADPYELDLLVRNQQFQATISTVVDLSLKRVRDICVTAEKYELAIRLLMAASHLDPQTAIPKTLLAGWIPDDEGEVEIDRILSALRSLSLLEDGDNFETYIIHGVIQDVLKLNESIDDCGQRLLQWSQVIKEKLNQAKRISVDEKEKCYVDFKNHAIIIVTQLNSMEKSEPCFLAQAKMHEIIGTAQQIKGEEKQAKESFERSLQYYNLVNVEYHIILKARIYYAAAVMACGEVNNASKLFQDILLELESLTCKHPTLIGLCMMHMGSARLLCGYSWDAKNLYERALRFLTSNLNERHIKVIKCQINLSASLEACKSPNEAKIYYKKSLHSLREMFGENHRLVGKCIMGLGNATLQSGNSQKALALYEKACSVLKSTMGQQHIDVGRCIMNMGIVKKLPESVLLFDEALIILRKALGDNHLDVGRCMVAKGKAMIINDPFSAIKILKNALEILECELGNDHSEVIKCIKYLGIANKVCRLNNQNALPEDTSWALTSLEMEISAVEVARSAVHCRKKAESENFEIYIQISKYIADAINNLTLGKIRCSRKNLVQALNYLIDSGKYSNQNEPKVSTWLVILRDALSVEYIEFENKSTNKYDYYGKLPIIVKNEFGTYFRKCVELNHFYLVRLFIECNFPINILGSSHETVLHIAVIKRHLECIKLLILAGADPYSLDRNGQTPMRLAKNQPELLELLEQDAVQHSSSQSEIVNKK